MLHPIARPTSRLLAIPLSIALIAIASSLALAAQTTAGSGATGPGATRDDMTAAEAVKALMQVTDQQEPAAEPPEATAAVKQEPLRVGGPVSRPEVLYRVNPVYPEDLRKKRAQGTVILESIIDEEGCVTRTKLLRAEETGFAEQAVAAVARWAFKPAMADGRAVAVYFTLTINFAIQPPRQP